MSLLANLVNALVQIVSLLVVVHVFLSYMFPPYHPSRQWLDRWVEPMLRPIRRLVPPIGMMDFSPVVLILLVQLVGRILVSILISFS